MGQYSNNDAPRHALHAAGGARPSRRPAGARGARGTHFSPSSPSYKPRSSSALFDSDGMGEQEAPRPVLDPSATGSFKRIDPSMGARVETRDNVSRLASSGVVGMRPSRIADSRLQGRNRPRVSSREPKVKTNTRLFAGIAIAAIVVVAITLFVMGGVLSSLKQPDGGGVVEQTQTDASQSIAYRGVTYKVEKQSNGKYALMGYPEGSDDGTSYFEFDGTPVQLVLYNGALIIPENLDGSWDVLSYTIGAGALPTQVMGPDDNPVTGEGSIDSVKLSDPNLVVTDSSGKTTNVALV